MARMHLRMGVPYFIDRDFEELASARGLQVRGLPVPGRGGSSGACGCGVRSDGRQCLLVLPLTVPAATDALPLCRTCCPSCQI